MLHYQTDFTTFLQYFLYLLFLPFYRPCTLFFGDSSLYIGCICVHMLCICLYLFYVYCKWYSYSILTIFNVYFLFVCFDCGRIIPCFLYPLYIILNYTYKKINTHLPTKRYLPCNVNMNMSGTRLRLTGNKLFGKPISSHLNH